MFDQRIHRGGACLSQQANRPFLYVAIRIFEKFQKQWSSSFSLDLLEVTQGVIFEDGIGMLEHRTYSFGDF